MNTERKKRLDRVASGLRQATERFRLDVALRLLMGPKPPDPDTGLVVPDPPMNVPTSLVEAWANEEKPDSAFGEVTRDWARQQRARSN
ncbi:MAG: hypothetical protein M0R73_12455 [Dehalococcoidia bacterium]|nr:hypothetical protein [Dehalococcoidia bacterium]